MNIVGLELSRETSCHVEDEFPLNQIMQCLCDVSFPFNRLLILTMACCSIAGSTFITVSLYCPLQTLLRFRSAVSDEESPGNQDRIMIVLVDCHHGPMGFHAH